MEGLLKRIPKLRFYKLAGVGGIAEIAGARSDVGFVKPGTWLRGVSLALRAGCLNSRDWGLFAFGGNPRF